MNPALMRQDFTVWVPKTERDVYGQESVIGSNPPIFFKAHYERFNELRVGGDGTFTIQGASLWTASKKFNTKVPFGDGSVYIYLRDAMTRLNTIIADGRINLNMVADGTVTDSNTEATYDELLAYSINDQGTASDYEYLPNLRGINTVWRFTV